MLFSELPIEQKKISIKENIDAILRLAKENNIVVTVETVPNKPLAMGNYEMVSSVREAR